MRFFLAFGLSVVLTPFLARLGVKLGFVDHPDQSLKTHVEVLPLAGGVAVIVSCFIALAVTRGWLPDSVIAGVALVTGVGLMDDRRPLPAVVRIAAQSLAGVALVAVGFRLNPLGPFAVVGVVLLVVVCTNAVNLVDGQDGMAGGLTAIAAIGMAAVAQRLGDGHTAELGLVTGGALVGFLVWNRPPARVFLGNNGAYGVGVLLAVMAARLIDAAGWHGVLAAGMCLAVFAFELAASAARRMRAGVKVAVGDRRHSYDLLVGGLVDVRTTSAVFWALGALAAALSLVVVDAPLATASASVFGLGVLLVLAGSRMWRGRSAVLPADSKIDLPELGTEAG